MKNLPTPYIKMKKANVNIYANPVELYKIINLPPPILSHGEPDNNSADFTRFD